jgi:hypothetical protein
MLLATARNKAGREIEEACCIVAGHYYGERGLWCYRAFAWINETLFFDDLPLPLITLGLTAHGKCLGWTANKESDKPPVIMLHPSIWRGTEKPDPWGIAPDLLGDRYALDVLMHECIHVSVHYRLGGPSAGDSSHNNPEWISEINRIAPLIGLEGVDAAMSKVTREGKKVRRVCKGNIPLCAAATFPHSVRRLWKRLDYYRDPSPLPF